MGTTLTGTTPQDTYDSLIKVTDNGPLSGTAKYLSDGLGNDSALALSTSAVGVGTSSPATALHVANTSNAVVRAEGTATNGESTFQLLGKNSSGTARSAIFKYDNSDVVRIGVGQAIDMRFETNDTERMRITSTGNVGIGTTPAAWGASTRALQLGAYGSLNALGGVDIGIANNAYYNGSNWVYIASQEAGKYLNNRNTFIFSTAPAGTAGANVTFTDVVRIDSDGLKFGSDTAAANALDDYEEGTWTMGISFLGASVDVTYANRTGTYTKIGRKVTVCGELELTNKGTSTGRARITGLPFTSGNAASFNSVASIYCANVTFANQTQAIVPFNTTTIDFYEITEAGAVTPLTDADFSNNSVMLVSATYFV